MKVKRVLCLLLCLSMVAALPANLALAGNMEDTFEFENSNRFDMAAAGEDGYAEYTLQPGDATAEGWQWGSRSGVTDFTVAAGALVSQRSDSPPDPRAILNDYVWGGTYTYRATVLNNYSNETNMLRLIFNYQDADHYYYINFGGNSGLPSKAAEVGLYKKSYDTTNKVSVVTKLASYPDFPVKKNTPITIVYDNGSITVLGGSEQKVLIDDYYDTAYPSGKIGVETVACATARFSNISVSGNGLKLLPLELLECSMEDGATEVEKTPTIELRFGFPLLSTSVTVSNVQVVNQKTGATLASSAYEPRLSAADPNVLEIYFKQPLIERTTYKVTVTTGVLSQAYRIGMLQPYVFSFTTKPADFELFSHELQSGSGAAIDMTKFHIYAGQQLNLHLELRNNYVSVPQKYVRFAAVEQVGGKRDGQALFTRAYEGTLSMGEKVVYNDSFTVPINDMAQDATYANRMYSFESLQSLKPENSTAREVNGFSNYNFMNATVNTDRSTVTVSGNLPNRMHGRNVTLVILNPGKTMSDVLASGTPIQKIAQGVTTANGAFSFEVPICFYDGAVEGGTFNVYLGGDDFTDRLAETSFVLYSTQKRQNAIREINLITDVATMLQFLGDQANVLGFHSQMFDNINLGPVAQKLVDWVAQQPFDPSAHEGLLREKVQLWSLLEGYNQSLAEAVIGSNGQIIRPDLLGLTTDVEDPIYTFYKGLSANGLKQVNAQFMGQDLQSVEQFKTLFYKNTVVFGICYYGKSGYGHVRNLLLEHGEQVGLDLTEYNKVKNKDNVDSQLVQENIKTLAQAQNAIDRLSREANSPRPSQRPAPVGTGGSRPSSSTNVGGTLEPIPQPTIAPKPEQQYELKDMENAAWAIPYVKQLIDREIIFEPAEGIFRPNDNITRAEFTKMVVLASQKLGSGKETGFADCPADHWAANYVASAKAAGYVTGISATEFGVDLPITRQDVAVILERVIGPVAGQAAADAAAQAQSFVGGSEGTIDIQIEAKPVEEIKFTDMDEIAEYALEAVLDLVGGGVINGLGDGRFAPREFCTRAQAAKLICAIMNR